MQLGLDLWPTRHLNRLLPPGYFAEEQIHAGSPAEIDVATFDNTAVTSAATSNGGPATLTAPTWAPPSPLATVPAVFADDFEVRVFTSRGGPTLVAAIEMASPANKDREETRKAFAIKCASYLHQAISLIVVDVVTDRHINLHNRILELMPTVEGQSMAPETHLYAVAYRPVLRDGRAEIDLWASHAVLTLGGHLPLLPLALSAELSMPVDLEATYMDACQRRRLTGS